MSTKLLDLIQNGQLEEVNRIIGNYDKDPENFIKNVLEKNENQISIIELFAILNNRSMIEKAISLGYDLNRKSIDGCSLVHYGAIWNRGDLIRYLYFAGADMYSRNKHNESAHDLAIKYEQTESIRVLEWTECRDQFIKLVHLVKETLSSADKNEFTKEEKKIAETACLDGESWINRNKDVTLNTMKTKKEQIELIVEPFLRKK